MAAFIGSEKYANETASDSFRVPVFTLEQKEAVEALGGYELVEIDLKDWYATSTPWIP